MKYEAVFISDLHLHPEMPEITQRFQAFLNWAKDHTRSIYILGDFFHVWAGDDLMDEFSMKILSMLKQLHEFDIKVYFMPGNRDFLIGKTFLSLANVVLLNDPSVICLEDTRIFLTHGDKYCLHDKPHQLLRMLSRPRWLRAALLRFPKKLRQRLIHSVRRHSQQQLRDHQSKKYEVVFNQLFQDMKKQHVFNVIYGHVHQPQYIEKTWKGMLYNVFILSDWDANPTVICYNKRKGIELLKFKV